MDDDASGLSSLQKVDLDYLEAPPKFAFEKKLDLVKDTSNISGIVKDDDDASSTATPLEVAFGDRSWSWLSAGSHKQQQSPIPTQLSQLPSRPEFRSRRESKGFQDMEGDMDRSSHSVKEENDMNIDKFANKVPPALWAQMKKLESLQNPFHDNNRAELKVSRRQQKKKKDATLDRVAAAMKKLEALQNPLEESDGVVLILSLESWIRRITMHTINTTDFCPVSEFSGCIVWSGRSNVSVL